MIQKHENFFALFLILWSSAAMASMSDTYLPFSVSPQDIAAVLDETIAIPVDNASDFPADICYACADIKYNHGSLKFCECGSGIYMSFRTAKISLNDHIQNVVSPYWGIFWHYLKQFGLPMWFVDDQGPKNAIAIETFKRLGGRYMKNFSYLASDPKFIQSQRKKFVGSNTIKKYRGIIVYRARRESERNSKAVKQFKKKHSEFLFINNASYDYFKRKDATYKLFEDASLSTFAPQSKIYPTQYSPSLIQQIQQDFTGDWLVIKPVAGSLAYGVNVVAKSDLNNFLKLIFQDHKTIDPKAPRGLFYWRVCHPESFLVSEYAPSQSIIKDNKPYDPTMRVVFIMHHDEGVIYLNVIAGFWKIPVKSLDDNVPLTDNHVTIAHSGAYYSGILMEPSDWKEVKAILQQVLPQLYATMLKQQSATGENA